MRTPMAAAAVLLAVAATPAPAGQELVSYPAGWNTGFVEYLTVLRPDRTPVQVRGFYANPEAVRDARPGQPLPHGTVLVMVDRPARLGADGQPVADAAGRWASEDRVLAIAVQEKRAGWGAEYPVGKRNGEWEYAAFMPDGARRTVNTDSCFGCHLPRKEADYTFTFHKWIRDGKP